MQYMVIVNVFNKDGTLSHKVSYSLDPSYERLGYHITPEEYINLVVSEDEDKICPKYGQYYEIASIEKI